jgi:type VI secretion system lysozyme-like protein
MKAFDDGAASGPKPRPPAEATREPSFVEKLAMARRHGGRAEEWSAQPVDAADLSPLIANLGNVLRTKKRHGSVVADLGLGDYDNPQRIKETMATLEREIREAVTRYEPRLRAPRVQAVDRAANGRIHYEITGTVAGAPVKIAVVFDTYLRTVDTVALV